MNTPIDDLRPWWIGFSLLLALSLLADVFIEHHAHFSFEDYFGFYAGYGFGAGIIMVIIANISPIAIGDPYRAPGWLRPTQKTAK